MDSIRISFRCALSIPLGIAFVAYKRPPLGPEGAQGPEGPLGPKGPKGPLVPWALWPWAFCMGPLAHPWARPGLLGIAETALRENCAARELRRNCAACKRVGGYARSVEEFRTFTQKVALGASWFQLSFSENPFDVILGASGSILANLLLVF